MKFCVDCKYHRLTFYDGSSRHECYWRGWSRVDPVTGQRLHPSCTEKRQDEAAITYGGECTRWTPAEVGNEGTP